MPTIGHPRLVARRRSRASLRIHASIWALLAVLHQVASPLVAAPANYVEMVRAKQAGKPNIILIVAHGLGYHDLGCYGQERIRTPHIDRLAGEGMRFTQWYAGSPQRVASRATLLTGQPASLSRSQGAARNLLPSDGSVLAAFLQDAGYKTCALGVWGMARPGAAGTPNAQGFDEWLGELDAAKAHDYYPLALWRNGEQQPLSQTTAGREAPYAPDLYTRAALRFLSVYAKFPCFLYLATPIPGANLPLTKLTGNGMQVPSPHPYSDRDWPEAERNRAAMITHLDETVGQILDTLEQLGLSRDTLIIVTSSSGAWKEGGTDPGFFSSNGELRGHGGELYEGGLRVPFVARWPGHVPAGKVVDVPAAHWDLFATAAELALTNAPPSVTGRSLRAVLLGETREMAPTTFVWAAGDDTEGVAVRDGDWKLLHPTAKAAPELYDLATDPAERHNVAEAHPEIVARLEEQLKPGRGR